MKYGAMGLFDGIRASSSFVRMILLYHKFLVLCSVSCDLMILSDGLLYFQLLSLFIMRMNDHDLLCWQICRSDLYHK